jgi:hypothetical protein
MRRIRVSLSAPGVVGTLDNVEVSEAGTQEGERAEGDDAAGNHFRFIGFTREFFEALAVAARDFERQGVMREYARWLLETGRVGRPRKQVRDRTLICEVLWDAVRWCRDVHSQATREGAGRGRFYWRVRLGLNAGNGPLQVLPLKVVAVR